MMKKLVLLFSVLFLVGCVTTQQAITTKNGQRYIQVNKLTPETVAQLSDEELIMAYNRAKTMASISQAKMGSDNFVSSLVWMDTGRQMSDVLSYIEIDMRRRGIQP